MMTAFVSSMHGIIRYVYNCDLYVRHVSNCYES
jgi:hypothetical protein